ncbi:hypothetical protein BCO9919_03049 [Burkholderia cenocepacia]|uniref:Uncharacterized protein n=1 Tax=Burkholderia cenocepacia TaxID=95486 RepID=A0A6J5J8V0_9BURK|nr:hypothetical protein BCO9919_03049 [Burkholderia cenocepacia]
MRPLLRRSACVTLARTARCAAARGTRCSCVSSPSGGPVRLHDVALRRFASRVRGTPTRRSVSLARRRSHGIAGHLHRPARTAYARHEMHIVTLDRA